MPDLRYPIGPFGAEHQIARQERRQLLPQLAEIPAGLREAVQDLSSGQLDTPYRPGGWTVRQVVHHLTDSHMNWYIRTRLALTEDEPTIKPFAENLWAELKDARVGPIEPSLLLLSGLHQRWVQLFDSLVPADWARRLVHLERGILTLEAILPMIVWHGQHHMAHITELRKRACW